MADGGAWASIPFCVSFEKRRKPIRMIPILVEGFRRLVAVGCFFTGMWMVVQPGGSLIVARVVDFDQSYSRYDYSPTPAGSVADFIRRRTEGRTLDATGTLWAGFATAMRDGKAGGYVQRLSAESDGIALVYRPASLPGSLAGYLRPLSYVHVPAENLWISLSEVPAQEIDGLDRRWAYPGRNAGRWLLPLAFLVYFLLPRRKVPQHALVYSRIPAVVLPDMLGLLGGAFFFTLPLWIVAENVPGQTAWSLEGGWSFLTGALWLMAAVFLLLHVVAFFYATLQLAITNGALVVNQGLRSNTYAWDKMERCVPYVSSRGRVMGLLLIIFARGPGMLGQGLLVASNTERGLEIRMTDGRKLKIMAHSFPGYAKVVEALVGHQIAGAAALEI